MWDATYVFRAVKSRLNSPNLCGDDVVTITKTGISVYHDSESPRTLLETLL